MFAREPCRRSQNRNLKFLCQLNLCRHGQVLLQRNQIPLQKNGLIPLHQIWRVKFLIRFLALVEEIQDLTHVLFMSTKITGSKIGSFIKLLEIEARSLFHSHSYAQVPWASIWLHGCMGLGSSMSGTSNISKLHIISRMIKLYHGHSITGAFILEQFSLDSPFTCTFKKFN